MPRKPGIFAQHKKEILQLKSKGVGDTEIATHLSEKYSIRVTKQNLAQSYEKYLKNRSSKPRKKAPKKRFRSASSNGQKNKLKSVPKTDPSETLESISNSHEVVDETLALRDRIPQIIIELEALLDAERMSGRFSPTECSILRGWAEALIALHPDTARTVFRSTFGGDFLTYREAFENALQAIRDANLASEFESRTCPDDEDTWLSLMKMNKAGREREEKERLRIELSHAKKLYPEAFNASELETINLTELLDPDKQPEG